ncbi:complement resistance protein TraT [Legionella drancourtii]|uniref:Lipoprotein YlpA n=1 Tax=Legionella drancourtii LLAP12 TaxID=658187 RepID=G9EQC8_9GAMM|nr:complement resistance protein TraT [Legionella drancourtii]EHL30523.1 hypothetical protein LDG_7475 [Legionella drancourtii LLAP12]
MKQCFIKTACMGTVILLTSCAATQTALEHRTLETDTHLKPTIFLSPVAQNQKTVFLIVRNTTQETVSIEKPLTQALTERGYRVVHNPSQAHYHIQANILKVSKMSQAASKKALGGAFGSTLAGAGTGAALGAFGNNNTTLAGGIAGGVIGLAADSLVKDVNYTMITDVQISERVGKGAVQQQFKASLENGSSSGTYQTMSSRGDYKDFKTRVVSRADKVNLTFEKAKPVLEQGLVRALSGLF